MKEIPGFCAQWGGDGVFLRKISIAGAYIQGSARFGEDLED